jgi:hypothetical protein
VTDPTPAPMAAPPSEQARWQPANEVEARMLAALGRDDRQEFFTILMTSPLYLPQTVANPDTATEANPEDYLTFVSRDVTYLLVFTSVETLELSVGHIANGYVESTYDTLRIGLVDTGIQLGFNMGTPIDAWLDADSMARAAAGEIAVPTGREMSELMELASPANAEAVEAATKQEIDTYVDSYVTGLIHGDALVPLEGGSWRVRPVDGVPTLEVYSAAEHAPPEVPTTRVPFQSVVANWPPTADRLTVNPGTPLEFSLPADVLEAFAEEAQLKPDNN